MTPCAAVRSSEILEIAAKATDSRLQGLMLYGSQARGDPRPDSDTDVLAIVPRPLPPHRIGSVNVTFYTEPHLLALARRGSLFVLHLMTEGRALLGEAAFSRIFRAFEQPDFEALWVSVRTALPLLRAPAVDYLPRWQNFHRAFVHLARTIVYARCAQAGEPCFAFENVCSMIGAADIRAAVSEIESADAPAYKIFSDSVAILEKEVGCVHANEDGSAEAYLVNHCADQLTVTVGLILTSRANASFAYEPVQVIDAS